MLHHMTYDIALCQYKNLRREYIEQSAIISRFEVLQNYLKHCRDVSEVNEILENMIKVARMNRKESEELAVNIVKKFPMIPANSFD